MADLVLNINFDESKKLKKAVLETYSGRIKILKSKTFSGPLNKVDIDTENFENISEEKFIELQRILDNTENFKVSKFKYILSENSFMNILKEGCKNNNLYATASKDKRAHLIENISIKEYLNYDYSRNKISLYLENRKDVISEKYDLINIYDNSVIYNSNTIIICKNQINVDFIQDVNSKKVKSDTQVIENNIYKSKQNKIEIIDQSQIKQSETKNIDPKAVLYISFKNLTVQGELYFKYDEIEIESNKKDEYLYVAGNRYYRKIDKEEYYKEKLVKFKWKKSKNNVFKNNIIQVDFLVNELIDNNFIVLNENKKKVISSKMMSFNISYNMNWFELYGDIRISERIYSLAELINLKDKRRNFVEIEGNTIVFPQIISKQKDNLYKKEKKIALPNEKIGEVFQLVEELNLDKSSIKDIISYENIELKLPNNLKEILRDYQIEGVKWLKYLYINKIGGCLADDMGLGKTLQAISLLSDEEFNANGKKVLIVLPKTLITNWKREIYKFNKNLKVDCYYGSNKSNILLNQKNMCGVYLTTYNTVLNDFENLKGIKFDCMILDEVQYIKNPKSKTYLAVNKLKASFRIALSGTPFENNISEIWALMNLINNSVWGTLSEFKKKYSDIHENKEKLDELKIKLSPYVLRRCKKDVLTNLPEKFEENIYCDMSDEQRELYESVFYKIQQELKSLPDRFEIKENSTVLKGLMLLRQICDHPNIISRTDNINSCKESGKFEVLKMRIEELVCNKQKVIIFSCFTSMLTIIEKWLRDKDYKYFYLDGQTINRQNMVDDFENSDEGIFLISIKAGGTGLNLTSCKYAIIYDPWWNPAVENQAADRIYRIGQTKDVTIYRLVTTNSIEEKIQELKDKKSHIADSLFNGLDNVKITADDLRKLFK